MTMTVTDTPKQLNLPAILALDPGGTTGWCFYEQWSNTFSFDCGQITDQNHYQRLFNFLVHIEEIRVVTPLHIICEKFEFRKTDQHRDKIDYTAAEYVGVVKLFAQQFKDSNVKLVMQSASGVKEKKQNTENPPFWTEAKIKHIGLWVPGAPHAMDATRHYLYYRTFTLKDKTLLYKLKDFGR